MSGRKWTGASACSGSPRKCRRRFSTTARGARSSRSKAAVCASGGDRSVQSPAAWSRQRRGESAVIARWPRSAHAPCPVGRHADRIRLRESRRAPAHFWEVMRRRDFIALIGGAAAARPLVVRAEQPDQVRRVGVLNALAEADPQAQAWEGAFRSRLTELGWIDGRNVHVDYRWGAASVDRLQSLAEELVRLKPDVLIAITTPATAALHTQTRSIPIVFAAVSDPIGSGFVRSLASPGGNITGFIDIEASLSGKWLDMMRAIAPRVTRVALLFNPQTEP